VIYTWLYYMTAQTSVHCPFAHLVHPILQKDTFGVQHAMPPTYAHIPSPNIRRVMVRDSLVLDYCCDLLVMDYCCDMMRDRLLL
jgi:hypothetical protein